MKTLSLPTKIALAAGFIVLLVYLRALSCNFVNYDDPDYILENTAIRLIDRDFFVWAFTTPYMGWLMPLTWISLALDYRVWGLDPAGYHLTNILLHAANTGLVVLIADRLIRRGSGNSDEPCAKEGYGHSATLLLAGLLWGMHPLRVESVAWVTERKDVLNGIFALGCILAYLSYVQAQEAGLRSNAARAYLFSVTMLLLSLLAKPVAVIIPGLLLVIDWYPLGRLSGEKFKRVLLEKVPFLIIAGALAAATVHFAADTTILVSYQDFPLHRRVVQAGYALTQYLWMTVYPVDLVHLYLLPQVFPVVWYISAAVSMLVICLCLWQSRKRAYLMAIWLGFVLPLLPVLGFFQNGAQSHAARFTYLPAIGLSIGAAAGGMKLFRALHSRTRSAVQLLLPLIAATMLLFYGVTTLRLIDSWKNPETLWSRLILIRPIGRAYYHRADYRLQIGQYLAAADDLGISIRMGREAGFPGLFNLHALRGDAFSKAELHVDAINEFSEAIRLHPLPNYFYHRGLALRALGRFQEAEADFEAAASATGPVRWQPFQ